MTYEARSMTGNKYYPEPDCWIETAEQQPGGSHSDLPRTNQLCLTVFVCKKKKRLSGILVWRDDISDGLISGGTLME